MNGHEFVHDICPFVGYLCKNVELRSQLYRAWPDTMWIIVQMARICSGSGAFLVSLVLEKLTKLFWKDE